VTADLRGDGPPATTSMIDPAATTPRSGFRRDAWCFVLLAAAGAWLYAPVFGIVPRGEDNLYVLSWADRASLSTLATVDPAIYPEWRPLAYLTVRLQYAWAGVGRVADYYVFNIAVWVLAAWLVYLVVRRWTRSRGAAVAAGLLVLVDPRAISPVAWIIGRQGTMACASGMAAVWLVLRSDGLSRRALRAVGIGLLLLASALSKEYGLAFAGALALHAMWSRRADVAASALGSVAVYAGLRIVLASGALAPYCQDMGYFTDLRRGFCIGGIGAAPVAQMAYNVGATAVGSLVRGLLDSDGRPGLSCVSLGLSLVWGAVLAAGWRHDRRAVRFGLSLAGTNALLSVLLYQPRNQVVAVCGIGVAAGAGVAALLAGPAGRRRWSRGALLAAVAGLLCLQASRTRTELESEVDALMRQSPCSALAEQPALEPFVDRLDDAYDLPACDPAPNVP